MILMMAVVMRLSTLMIGDRHGTAMEENRGSSKP